MDPFSNMSDEALRGELLAMQSALDERAKAEALVLKNQPRVQKKFRVRIKASSYILVMAYDCYEADQIIADMTATEIKNAVFDNGGWTDVEADDFEFPEEV